MSNMVFYENCVCVFSAVLVAVISIASDLNIQMHRYVTLHFVWFLFRMFPSCEFFFPPIDQVVIRLRIIASDCGDFGREFVEIIKHMYTQTHWAYAIGDRQIERHEQNWSDKPESHARV